MTTFKEKAEFVGLLSGSAITAEKDQKLQDARARKMGELLGDGLPPTDREDLRKAMTFKVRKRGAEGKDDDKDHVQSMDERGQRKSIETEDARSRYQSIDPADYAKVQKALEKIIAMKEQMLEAKDPEGQLLFDKADLMTELFAPLVREGLMPENLVIDEHSETGRLLKNTYESYLKMLKEAREERMEKDAESTVNLHGGADKMDVLKAFGAKAKGLAQAQVGVVANKVGLTPEETMRLGNMVYTGVNMTRRAYAVGPAAGGLIDTVSGTSSPLKTPKIKGLTKDTYGVLSSGVQGGVGIAKTSKSHLDTEKSGKKENRNHELEQAALACAAMVDQAVCDALIQAHTMAMGALEGRIASAIDPEDMVDVVLADRPQAARLTEIVGQAMASQLAAIGGSGQAAAAFAKAAKQLASEFASRVDAAALTKAMDISVNPIADCFDPLVAAAAPAAAAAFSAGDFVQALQGAKSELLDAAALNNEALTEQLEQSEQQAEDFERQLVLIDDGGTDMARQRSIAMLIAQLEKDRLDLEIVLKVGSLLGSFGASVTKLGVDSSNFDMGTAVGTVATQVGQSLVPALKAAQLVMQMSVTIIQIARRAEIAGKFSADVEKARKAGSALLPVVENFYSAKVAQQTFASIELALQTVQLAGAICSSVPEPITQATGRVLTAIGSLGSAGNKFAKQAYTDDQLRKGWQRTLEAINNPANRRAGLVALRSNGTLAAHAVAWAAVKGGDAIAKEILNSCGVDAQSLADSASDQDAVVNFLEKKLHEDIKFKDPDKIDTNWAPSPPQLSYPGWFVLLNRAVKDATPRMSSQAPDAVAIGTALKALDVQPRPQEIDEHLADYTGQQVVTWCAQVREAEKQLRAFKPTTVDGKPHTAMLHLCTVLADQADARADTLEALSSRRRVMLQAPPPQEPQGRQRSNAIST